MPTTIRGIRNMRQTSKLCRGTDIVDNYLIVSNPACFQART